jgi:hypothetical protein
MSERRLRVLTARSIVSYRPADGASRASDTAARRRSGRQRAYPVLSARVGRGDGRSHAREADRARRGASARPENVAGVARASELHW